MTQKRSTPEYEYKPPPDTNASSHRIAVFSKITDPFGIIVDAVFILCGHIPVSLVGRLLAVGVFQMRLEVVGTSEWGRLATRHPALVQAVFGLLMNSLFMSFLVLLALEAFGSATLVSAARIAASKLILGDDDFTVDAGLAL